MLGGNPFTSRILLHTVTVRHVSFHYFVSSNELVDGISWLHFHAFSLPNWRLHLSLLIFKTPLHSHWDGLTHNFGCPQFFLQGALWMLNRDAVTSKLPVAHMCPMPSSILSFKPRGTKSRLPFLSAAHYKAKGKVGIQWISVEWEIFLRKDRVRRPVFKSVHLCDSGQIRLTSAPQFPHL